MKGLRMLILALALLAPMACSDDPSNRNPYLQEIGFRFDINLNLPLYSPLNFISNSVYVNSSGSGIRGFFITNTGTGFRAFEASCPNHPPNSCSTMEMEGQLARCACEGYEYSLFTGQLLNRPNDGERYFDMLEYRASQNGNVITVSN